MKKLWFLLALTHIVFGAKTNPTKGKAIEIRPNKENSTDPINQVVVTNKSVNVQDEAGKLLKALPKEIWDLVVFSSEKHRFLIVPQHGEPKILTVFDNQGKVSWKSSQPIANRCFQISDRVQVALGWGIFPRWLNLSLPRPEPISTINIIKPSGVIPVSFESKITGISLEPNGTFFVVLTSQETLDAYDLNGRRRWSHRFEPDQIPSSWDRYTYQSDNLKVNKDGLITIKIWDKKHRLQMWEQVNRTGQLIGRVKVHP